MTPPEPDPPEPPVGDTMIAKVKNTLSQTIVFEVRAFDADTQSDVSTEQRVKLGYNEEHTFTVPLGSNEKIAIRWKAYNTSYPDVTDAYYVWTSTSNISWKINGATDGAVYIKSVNGLNFSGTFDNLQNYATQS